MSSFDFKRLIKKYSKSPVTLRRFEDGYFDYENGGSWVEGKEENINVAGAVVPLSNSDLNYDEGGTYTSEDRKIYTYEVIELGEKVTHKEKEYTIREGKDYTDFDEGLNIYFMKRVVT